MRTKNTNLKDVWQTPPKLLNLISEAVDLDPCAGEGTDIGRENYRSRGTERPWFGTVFVNPPFSQKEEFLEKAVAERDRTETIYVVTPDSTDTKSWWHGYIARYADYIWFSRGRINYLSPKGHEPKPERVAETSGVTFGTAISIFGEPPAETLRRLAANGQLVQSYRLERDDDAVERG